MSEEVRRAIRQALETRTEAPIGRLELEEHELRRGHVAERVTRIDARWTTLDGAAAQSFVLKPCAPEELELMRTLDEVGSVDARFARWIAGSAPGITPAWMLVAFVPGSTREGRFELPEDVARTLAHVHTHFASRLQRVSFLPSMDQEFWASLLQSSDHALAATAIDDAAREKVRSGIELLRRTPEIPRWIRALPWTLLHGDVHGGNMIDNPDDGRTHLIDWGNAKIGPEFVDLANCIASADDPTLGEYWECVRASGGTPLGVEQRRAAFSIAKIIVNLTYLPFALRASRRSTASA